LFHKLVERIIHSFYYIFIFLRAIVYNILNLRALLLNSSFPAKEMAIVGDVCTYVRFRRQWYVVYVRSFVVQSSLTPFQRRDWKRNDARSALNRCRKEARSNVSEELLGDCQWKQSYRLRACSHHGTVDNKRNFLATIHARARGAVLVALRGQRMGVQRGSCLQIKLYQLYLSTE